MSVNTFVIGSGGREDATLMKLLQSPGLGKLYIAPGNGRVYPDIQKVNISATDIDGLLTFCEKNQIDLAVVGPEGPLALGIGDGFLARGIPAFAPTRLAAQLELSKTFAKNLLRRIGAPTAPFESYETYENALAYVRQHGAPVVVKADGPALGKGVYVCHTIEEAENALKLIMVDKVHGIDAGRAVVIEDFLEGQEVSIHAFCDGKNFVLFPASQDHKAAFDGDTGPNSGGMGVYVPVPWVSDEDLRKIGETMVRPVLDAMRSAGIPFVGCMYLGLMLTSEGYKVLEINARIGDPEAQAYFPTLKSDLLTLFSACAHGTVADYKLDWHYGYSVCVVLASAGYPGEYERGIPIFGVEEAEKVQGVQVFHAGTKRNGSGQLETNGGRVLNVTGSSTDLARAIALTYQAASFISFAGMHFRRDIAQKAFYPYLSSAERSSNDG